MDFDARRSVIQVLDNVFFTSSNQASKQTNKRILFRMTLPSVEGITVSFYFLNSIHSKDETAPSSSTNPQYIQKMVAIPPELLHEVFQKLAERLELGLVVKPSSVYTTNVLLHRCCTNCLIPVLEDDDSSTVCSGRNIQNVSRSETKRNKDVIKPDRYESYC